MISVVGRSNQLAPAFKASVQTVSLGLKNVVPGAVLAADEAVLNTKTDIITRSSMGADLSKGFLRASCGPAGRPSSRHVNF